jgi:hypothetical protein
MNGKPLAAALQAEVPPILGAPRDRHFVPHSALHAAQQKYKRARARVAELEAENRSASPRLPIATVGRWQSAGRAARI